MIHGYSHPLRGHNLSQAAALSIASGLLALAAAIGHLTWNQLLAVGLSMVVLTAWLYNKQTGFILGLMFFLTKPLWVRVAYAVDTEIWGNGGPDVLGITPALLLSTLIATQLFFEIAKGEKICPDRTRKLLMVFSILAFLSIFNSANSIIVGLGGFERNVLPNMMILFLACSIYQQQGDTSRLLKALVVLGLVSCLYGIGQYIFGIYPWESKWIMDVPFKETTAGWLTVGLQGVEFRIFSVFYGYMDFFFTNVLIFSLALAGKSKFNAAWAKVRLLYMISWFLMLGLSLERMPIAMTLVTFVAVRYLQGSARVKRAVVLISSISIVSAALLLQFATPYLASTGADKLARLGEMRDPVEAGSIQDRAENFWAPALATIKSHPMGVGIGYGSQTRASQIASERGYYVKPHDELIQKTLEVGIVGGIVFLLLLISVFRDSLNVGKSAAAESFLGYAMVAGSFAFWLCGTVNLPFAGSPGLVYWALAGIVIGINNRNVAACNTQEIAQHSYRAQNGAISSLYGDGKKQ